MKFQLFAVVALVGGALVGCKVTTTEDGTGGAGGGAGGAGGGEGGSGNVTSTTGQGPTTTATTTSNGTTTGGLACDTGEMAAGDSPVCDDCVNCALADQCSDELATFQGTPGAQDWVACVFGDQSGMGGCPDDDMATADVNEFQVCLDGCNMASPGVEEAYLGVLGCAICVECPNNCDAASVCTGG